MYVLITSIDTPASAIFRMSPTPGESTPVATELVGPLGPGDPLGAAAGAPLFPWARASFPEQTSTATSVEKKREGISQRDFIRSQYRPLPFIFQARRPLGGVA